MCQRTLIRYVFAVFPRVGGGLDEAASLKLVCGQTPRFDQTVPSIEVNARRTLRHGYEASSFRHLEVQ